MPVLGQVPNEPGELLLRETVKTIVQPVVVKDDKMKTLMVHAVPGAFELKGVHEVILGIILDPVVVAPAYVIGNLESVEPLLEEREFRGAEP